MKQRSVASVIILTLVTFGIYGLVWQVKTKGEMNKLGASIPTAWLLIIPIANIWWLWKYSEGVELVTKNKLSAIMTFVLFWLVGIIGMAIVQSEFNHVSEGSPAATAAPAPMVPTMTAATPAEEPTASVAPEAAAPTAATDTSNDQAPTA